MSEVKKPGVEASAGESAAGSRWPQLIGTLGVILGALMALDMIDDMLIHLFWSKEVWAHWVGLDLADLLTASLPPLAWRVLSAVIQIALGILLVAGSLRVRRRQVSGVWMCRTWAKLAVVWVFVIIGSGIWWIVRYGDQIPGASEAHIGGAVLLGLVIAAAVLLAYPLFLLSWFAREDIQAETGTWSE